MSMYLETNQHSCGTVKDYFQCELCYVRYYKRILHLVHSPRENLEELDQIVHVQAKTRALLIKTIIMTNNTDKFA